jgi:hypothetical protein
MVLGGSYNEWYLKREKNAGLARETRTILE